MVSTEEEEAALLARFGISKVLTFNYHYREWRYSSLDDAMAQAKRDLASKRQ